MGNDGRRAGESGDDHGTAGCHRVGLSRRTNCGLGADAEGALFYGTYNNSQIRQVTLDSSRRNVASESTVFTDPGGGVLAIERAPSGALYFSDQSGIYQLVIS
ncbi:MAG: hypothetical protein ACR2GF_02020 [Acidimicrobiales bacterium]